MSESLRPSPEFLATNIMKLDRERLVEELKGEVDVQEVKRSKTKTQLANLVVSVLSSDRAIALASEGKATQRLPTVGGPTWSLDGLAVQGDFLLEKSAEIIGELPENWSECTLASSDPDKRVYILRYKETSPMPTEGSFADAISVHRALILPDRRSAFTVSANNADHERAIGVAIAKACRTPTTVEELALPRVDSYNELSSVTVGMIHAVYGRVGSVAEIMSVETVWTARPNETPDPARLIRDGTRGRNVHLLTDASVRERLKNGHHLQVMASMVRWVKEDKDYLVKVTIAANDPNLVFRVTRIGDSVALTSELFHLIRSALHAATPNHRLQVIARQLGDLLE